MNRKSRYESIIKAFHQVGDGDGFGYRLQGTKNSDALKLVDDNNRKNNVEFYSKRNTLYITYWFTGYKIESALVDNTYYSGRGMVRTISPMDMVSLIIKKGIHEAVKGLV